MNVDALFGDPTVALRGPWNNVDLVKIGPTADDLVDLYEYHLDFPGDALDPGCSYQRWARPRDRRHAADGLRARGHRPGPPGKLALQYWLFYAYNDWNNLHEGDWEMIQLVFDATSAQEALSQEPVEVGYSQHEGASGRSGATRSSSSSTGRTPSSIRPPGRTRTSTRRGSTSAARPNRESAATTRAARPRTSGRSCGRSRATRPRRAPRLPVDRVRGPLGRAPAARSSTARPGRT